ncbi:MAG: hypothetical protein KGL39_44870 [Patescibacteria group bacterium]|nr:hypothetical protein [Patescibacteria group bacterium]
MIFISLGIVILATGGFVKLFGDLNFDFDTSISGVVMMLIGLGVLLVGIVSWLM